MKARKRVMGGRELDYIPRLKIQNDNTDTTPNARKRNRNTEWKEKKCAHGQRDHVILRCASSHFWLFISLMVGKDAQGKVGGGNRTYAFLFNPMGKIGEHGAGLLTYRANPARWKKEPVLYTRMIRQWIIKTY